MTPGFLTQFVSGILPGRRKASANGWISFNAPCCIYHGESADTRGRGGVILNADGGVSYHCFNCNYKTSYAPGRPLSYKFRKLLSWLGASDNDIRQLVIEAIRVKEFVEITKPEAVKEEVESTYRPRPLPAEATSFKSFVTFMEVATTEDKVPSLPDGFHRSVDYVWKRKIDMQRYDFYWTPEVENKLSYRVIIPFTWKNEIIGYSARAFEEGIKPKYHTQHEPNYVFNVDQQRRDSKFVVVVEGPFDAMSIDGVAVCSNECSETQADIIDSLGREVIVVPDFDRHINKRGQDVWAGSRLVDQAIEYGWTVSFPVWRETCKDVNEAVVKYGKLFVLKAILAGRESNRLKIELMKKKVMNG
jgi:hypothetical protein